MLTDCQQEGVWYVSTNVHKNCLKMYKISNKTIDIIMRDMGNWWMDIITENQTHDEVKSKEESPGGFTNATASHYCNYSTQPPT